MERGEKEQWEAELHTHEQEALSLEGQLRALQSITLSTEDDASAQEVRDRIVVANAELMKHRIAIALLRSRLRNRSGS
jgi:hypothetical protein